MGRCGAVDGRWDVDAYGGGDVDVFAGDEVYAVGVEGGIIADEGGGVDVVSGGEGPVGVV